MMMDFRHCAWCRLSLAEVAATGFGVKQLRSPGWPLAEALAALLRLDLPNADEVEVIVTAPDSPERRAGIDAMVFTCSAVCTAAARERIEVSSELYETTALPAA